MLQRGCEALRTRPLRDVRRDSPMTPSAIASYCRRLRVVVVAVVAKSLLGVVLCASAVRVAFEFISVHCVCTTLGILIMSFREASDAAVLHKFPARLHRHMSGQQTHTHTRCFCAYRLQFGRSECCECSLDRVPCRR